MRILYVEDNATDGELTRRWLQRQAPQHELETRATCHEARARLLDDALPPIDLVLTDLRLPDGDGLTLLREIRERSLPLAVVVLTGAGSEETAVAALKAGADDYLVKSSHHLEQLPLTLEHAWHRHQAETARQAQPLRVLYAEHSQADIKLTLRHFARHARHFELDVVNTGPQALAQLLDSNAPRYDVALLDYRLPGLDGIELLKRLRPRPEHAIPVVMITGQGDDEVMFQALRLGASGYVIKNPGYLYRLPAELESAHYRWQLEKERAALHESEVRTRALLRAIPDLMFVQSDDGVYLDSYARNPADLLVPPDEFLGKNMRDVLPHDIVSRFIPAFQQARLTGEPQVVEYPLQIRGQDRVFEARIVSIETGRMLTIVREVTDQVEAQQALSQSNERIRLLAGRLIAAQEEERIRIANELHDDLSQRMAALAINLSQLRHLLTDAPQSSYPFVAALEREATGLADRTRALSHQLHSAVLEHVGLEAALKSFCSDFPSLEVDLDVGAIPAHLAPSIQLCLYRVVQETLTNARRHSGASRAQVSVRQTDEQIELTVRDAGTGFDPERARHKGGLGLISLEERVRLVGGSLHIDTAPGHGTRLRVMVPAAAQ